MYIQSEDNTYSLNALDTLFRPVFPDAILQMPLKDSLNLEVGTGPATFTRSTTATFIDKDDGLVKTAAIDAARFETNGILIEGASTNLLVRSEEFDDAAWSKTNATISANATASPDGLSTADKLIESIDSTVQHRLNQTPTSNTNTHTLSVYAKAAERSQINLRMGTTGANVFFNLDTGTTTGSPSAGNTHLIEDAGNGWFRCSLTVDAPVANAVSRINIAVDSNFTYTGDGASGLFLWGAQLEELPFASSYIPTTTVAVTRAADNLSVPSSNIPSPTDDYSVSASVDILGTDTVNRKFVWDTAETQRTVFIETSNRLKFESGGAFQNVQAAGTMGATVHKYAGTSDTSTIELFFDGVSEGTAATTTITGTATDIKIGQRNDNMNHLFGHLKNFQIWNVELTPTQVAAL